MNRLLLTTAIASLPAGGIKAQSIGYTYDAGGNCVSREVVLDGSAMRAQDLNARLSGSEVTIHPNPTEGALVVEIRNFDKASPVSLLLYTTQGQVITRQAMTSPTATLDLSGQPDGLYILQVGIDGHRDPWKVIKK